MNAHLSPCVFCNIINGLDDTELLFEDGEICVFRDIKPASSFHILAVPKRHIEDVKSLTPADKQLVEHMYETAKDLVTKNDIPVEDARFGYHWPPFRSVKHLHLHAIAPESEMGLLSRMIFRKESYWFVSCGPCRIYLLDMGNLGSEECFGSLNLTPHPVPTHLNDSYSLIGSSSEPEYVERRLTTGPEPYFPQ